MILGKREQTDRELINFNSLDKAMSTPVFLCCLVKYSCEHASMEDHEASQECRYWTGRQSEAEEHEEQATGSTEPGRQLRKVRASVRT